MRIVSFPLDNDDIDGAANVPRVSFGGIHNIETLIAVQSPTFHFLTVVFRFDYSIFRGRRRFPFSAVERTYIVSSFT